MAFCEVATIRNITGMSETDYSDDELADFISMAQKEVLSKIQQKIIREHIQYVDQTRENDLDSVNTTFYLSKCKDNFLGDMDYDGDIDTDDIKVYQVDNNAVETVLTPASIDSENMSFTLNTAPTSNVDLYVTYTYSPYDLTSPDPIVSQVTAYLASSYVSITDGSDDSIRFGNVSISGGSSGKGIYGNKYYQKYQELMAQLIENSTGGAMWGESFVKI